MMTTPDKILALVRTSKVLVTQDVVKALKISRQTASEHLSRLVQKGILVKSGSTRSAEYRLGGVKSPPKGPTVLVLNKKLKGLEEDRVQSEVALKLALKSKLSEKAMSIFSYAFTEMLNNAIDHSGSRHAKISVGLSLGSIYFVIRDFGIGAYSNVRKRFKLESEFDALEHLFKGKQTTDPARHSGEGIFFTSRIADRFTLRSHRLEATRDNQKEDLFVKDVRDASGTEVRFEIKTKTKKSLSSLFAQYTDTDLEFDKNVVKIKISEHQGALSRSEARRLLFGLEKFKQITFDFAGVKEMGQGFADEIFRVFSNYHPKIKLLFSNANPAVSFMISRALRAK